MSVGAVTGEWARLLSVGGVTGHDVGGAVREMGGTQG